MGVRDCTHRGQTRLTNFAASVCRQVGQKKALFTGERLSVSFHRPKRTLRGALQHVGGQFSFQPLLAIVLSADSAVTGLCVVYD